jgi:hypothetical protein
MQLWSAANPACYARYQRPRTGPAKTAIEQRPWTDSEAIAGNANAAGAQPEPLVVRALRELHADEIGATRTRNQRGGCVLGGYENAGLDRQ